MPLILTLVAFTLTLASSARCKGALRPRAPMRAATLAARVHGARDHQHPAARTRQQFALSTVTTKSPKW